MAKFFLPTNSARDDNFRSPYPDYVYLPYNMGRSIPRQPDHQAPFINPPSNSIDLAKWINFQIEEGNIIIPSGAADGNGIYSGNGTIPNNTIARLNTTFGISPLGTSNEYNLYLTPTSSQLGVGTGPSTYSYRLTLTETTATFVDDINSGGLKYAADYSAQFVPLSLVTKQYVDSLAGNGIYGGSGNIPSGSTIAELDEGLVSNFSFQANGVPAFSAAHQYTALGVGNTSDALLYQLVLNGNPQSATFYDFNNTGGLKYGANYSANYTVRSLVDKGYIDQVLDGRKWKQSVLVATTANITLSGEQTIDGVLTSSSRVLVKDQIDQTQNGIYISSAGAWVRSTDANENPELVAAAVSVEQGTIGANEQWFQQTDPVTIGSSNIVWVPIGSGVYTADGEGIEVFANEFSIELDGNSLSKSAAGLKVNTLSGWTGVQMKTGSVSIGVAGAFNVNVPVGGYTGSDIMVQLRDASNEVFGGAGINTTVSGGNITIAGFTPANITLPFIIKYILIAPI